MRFTNNVLLEVLGRIGNKWGTGHESVTKVLRKTRRFLNQKKDRIKFLDQVVVFVEMLEAYSDRKYIIDDNSLGLIISSLAYLILPTDLIPDFVIGFGFTDDAAVFIMVFKQLKSEIERFKAWQLEEIQQKQIASTQVI
ncbi:MAG: YkvA family protein [Halanaerobiales bacterium]